MIIGPKLVLKKLEPEISLKKSSDKKNYLKGTVIFDPDSDSQFSNVSFICSND